MRYLDGDALRRALPMPEAIAAMRGAFADDREVPARVRLGPSLFMPGRVGEVTGVKVVSTVPGDPAGLVAAFDATGTPLGIVDGPTLTALRTGAASGLATDLLASAGAATLTMLGAGAMARDQIAAVLAVRPIERILVWSRDPTRAAALAARVDGEVMVDPAAAVAAADVVCTATPATVPLFPAEVARPGVHVNAIGAFTPTMCELPAALLRSAYVVVDDRAAAATEAGDLLRAGVEPDATIGDLLAGRAEAPPMVSTVFKSVGIASQDVAAAAAALRRAERLGLGTVL